MTLPVIRGVIRRRLLVNFRLDADVVSTLLPENMKPITVNGAAIGGICLIRLERIRPKGPACRWLPSISSENAAHRFAVYAERDGAWEEAVYIPRRDTDSRINHFAGGRLFPGEHHLARFTIRDQGGEIDFSMNAVDESVEISLRASASGAFPTDSCFESLQAASAFFESGSRGYSRKKRPGRFDGVDLRIPHWEAMPLQVHEIYSSYFGDPRRFPRGTATFDHALLMRNVDHEWHAAPKLALSRDRASTRARHPGRGRPQ